MVHLTQERATELATQVLQAAGAGLAMAQAAAQCLVQAESQGLVSHGLYRLGQYATHLRNGRANGAAVPTVRRPKPAVLVVDAQGGLAFGACALAVEQALVVAREQGVCFAGVVNSHHAGVMVDHLRPVAAAGLVGLAFSNAPAAMPVAGGRHPVFGTNPVAAIFPRRAGDPLMIDLSLSEVARGKLMVAAREGKPIPAGWALDRSGRPTTDPQAGMDGMMLALGGGAKGAMLALMVELLVSAVIGARFSSEASTFFVDEGNAPGLGQAFLLIDPGALAGSEHFLDRVEQLIADMLQDPDVRLPGARRLALERQAVLQGLNIADELHLQLLRLAAVPFPTHSTQRRYP
jgi:(2R)-3-sulfolactate dehydrogenase (NADP+)